MLYGCTHGAHVLVQTWIAVEHNLGVHSALLPTSVEQGRQLLHVSLDRQSAAAEAGELLTQALVDYTQRALSGILWEINTQAP